MCEAEPHILNARMLAVERKRFSVIRRTVGLAVLYMVYRNSGNWVTDMIFRDDDCRVRTDHAPANFTTLTHMAHNLIGKAPPGKDCLRLRRKVAAWDDEFCS